MTARRLASGVLAAALHACCSGLLAAQVWSTSPAADSSTLRPELRIDWFGGRASALHAGGGLSVRAGNYVRVGMNAGAGAAWSDSVRNVAHADLTARFMLDPFRQQTLGLSMGGGIAARHEGDGVRAFALLFVDAEAGRGRGWTPFIRAGVGGGVRIAGGIRRATSRSR